MDTSHDEKKTNPPVLLMASGWRSGSTLVQRILFPECFCYGEPWGRTGLLNSLAEPWRHFEEGWPPQSFHYDGRDVSDLPTQWTANLYPPEGTLEAAYRALFTTLFADPARAAGCQHWGTKTVRCGAHYVDLMRRLFPGCKVIYLTRNIDDAWASYKAKVIDKRRVWYRRWPDQPIAFEWQFREHHERRAEEFARDQTGFQLRYENFRERFNELQDFVGFPLSEEASDFRIG